MATAFARVVASWMEEGNAPDSSGALRARVVPSWVEEGKVPTATTDPLAAIRN